MTSDEARAFLAANPVSADDKILYWMRRAKEAESSLRDQIKTADEIDALLGKQVWFDRKDVRAILTRAASPLPAPKETK